MTVSTLNGSRFPHNIKLAYLCTQSICLIMSPGKHTCFIHRELHKSYKKLPTIVYMQRKNGPKAVNIGGNTNKSWNLLTQLRYTAKVPCGTKFLRVLIFSLRFLRFLRFFQRSAKIGSGKQKLPQTFFPQKITPE